MIEGFLTLDQLQMQCVVLFGEALILVLQWQQPLCIELRFLCQYRVLILHILKSFRRFQKFTEQPFY